MSTDTEHTDGVANPVHVIDEQLLVDAIASGERERVQELIAPLHYSDLADVLEHLSADERQALVNVIGVDLDADVLSELDDAVREDIIEHLGVEADKVTDTASFIDDLGADSLDTVDLVMAFEEEFGV